MTDTHDMPGHLARRFQQIACEYARNLGPAPEIAQRIDMTRKS